MAMGFKTVISTALLLAACSRASSPPPASDATAAPSSAAPTTEPLPPATSAAAEPAPAASATASPWATPGDCSDKSESRERATCEAKEEFRAFVAGHQSCQSAADCTIVTGSCPFGCFVPVAKASQAETIAKLGSLGDKLDKAGNRCVYRCMAPPAEACVAGRCSAGPN